MKSSLTVDEKTLYIFKLKKKIYRKGAKCPQLF